MFDFKNKIKKFICRNAGHPSETYTVPFCNPNYFNGPDIVRTYCRNCGSFLKEEVPD